MVIQTEVIKGIIEAYPRDKRFALGILQDMQHHFRYIPREGLSMLAQHLNTPLSSLYSMATFYKALSLTPKGEHIIKVCDGTACHIRGANQLIDMIYRTLQISPGETTQDGLFSLETVNCLGSCALAPVMVVDDTYYGKVTLERLQAIVKEYQAGGAPQ